MYDFLREHVRDLAARLIEKPTERLLKPCVVAAVLIALLTIAAQSVYERSLDRKALGALMQRSGNKDPMRTGSVMR